MSLIFKCDRCGEYEDKKGYKTKRGHTHTITYRSLDTDTDTDTDTDSNTLCFEVCNKCAMTVKDVLITPVLEKPAFPLPTESIFAVAPKK